MARQAVPMVTIKVEAATAAHPKAAQSENNDENCTQTRRKSDKSQNATLFNFYTQLTKAHDARHMIKCSIN